MNEVCIKITCEQCGRDIQSNLCKNYCDEDKRWTQFERANEEVKKKLTNNKNS